MIKTITFCDKCGIEIKEKDIYSFNFDTTSYTDAAGDTDFYGISFSLCYFCLFDFSNRLITTTINGTVIKTFSEQIGIKFEEY